MSDVEARPDDGPRDAAPDVLQENDNVFDQALDDPRAAVAAVLMVVDEPVGNVAPATALGPEHGVALSGTTPCFLERLGLSLLDALPPLPPQLAEPVGEPGSHEPDARPGSVAGQDRPTADGLQDRALGTDPRGTGSWNARPQPQEA